MKRKTQARKLGQAHRRRRLRFNHRLRCCARARTLLESMGHQIATRISARTPQGAAQTEQDGTTHAE